MQTKHVWLVLLALIVIGALAGIRVVDPSETAAVVVLGEVRGTAGSGLSWNLPWPLATYDRYQNRLVVYQTSKVDEDTGEILGDAEYMDTPVEIKTEDGQTATVEFNIGFHIEEKDVTYVRNSVSSNMKDLVERVIAFHGRSVPRNLAAEYTAEGLYAVDRAKFEAACKAELSVIFAEYGVVLDEFALRDVNFSKLYEDSIEAQQIARENIETEAYNADAAVNTAKQTEELAKGTAAAALLQANAAAEATKLQADADAYAIEAKGLALRSNPEVMNLLFFDALKEAEWMMVPWDSLEGYMPVTP